MLAKPPRTLLAVIPGLLGGSFELGEGQTVAIAKEITFDENDNPMIAVTTTTMTNVGTTVLVVAHTNFDRRKSRPQIAPDRARSRRSPRDRKIATRSQDRLRSRRDRQRSQEIARDRKRSHYATTSTVVPT